MNQIVDNYSEILKFAKSYGLPQTKKRAILREYLQSKILSIFYQNKLSINCYFIGGTLLRLLHNLDRFSEDMDFDLKVNNQKDISDLILNIHRSLKKENIEVDFYKNKTAKRAYFELRFPNLLPGDEKLRIKFDFENFWTGHKREIILFNRYGFLINVISIPLDQILVQKLYTYLNRKQTLSRDLYDIIWLVGHDAKVDVNFAKKNKIDLPDLLVGAKKKYLREKNTLRNLKAKLQPFLINEKNVTKLDYFLDIVNTI